MEQKSLLLVIGALVLGGAMGYLLKTPAQPVVAPVASPSSAVEQVTKPHEGFTLHIDAEKHFPGDAKTIAHHWCKEVRGGMFECQLYESDEKDARLVGIELVAPTAMWQAFDQKEKAMWHYHKEEIPKVNAKLPDLSSDEAAKVVKTLEETYGKVYLLWDPTVNKEPVGNPSVTVL